MLCGHVRSAVKQLDLAEQKLEDRNNIRLSPWDIIP